MSLHTMTIGTLAKKADTHVETVRYYQRRGLLPVPEKPYGGIRHYDESFLARLHFIQSAQWLGFSLEEIGELLTLEDGNHCEETRALAEHKLNAVRQKIDGLQQIEGTLERLVECCRSSQSSEPCPIIHSLYGDLDSGDSPASL